MERLHGIWYVPFTSTPFFTQYISCTLKMPPVSLLNNVNHVQNDTGNTDDLVLPIAPIHDPIILGANNVDDIIVDKPVNICGLFLIKYIFPVHSEPFRWMIYTRQHAMI